LPAPKNAYVPEDENKTPVVPANLAPKKSATVVQTEVVVKPKLTKAAAPQKEEVDPEIQSLEEEKKKELNEQKIELQKQKSAQSQKAFRDLLKSATITVPQMAPVAEPEVAPPSPTEGQYANEAYPDEMQQPNQQPDVIGVYPGFYQQSFEQQPPMPVSSGMPMPADPSMARQFKDFYTGRANIVDIAPPTRSDAPRYHEPLVQPMPSFSNDSYNYVIPTRDARKQHQVTYLVWEAKQKAAELDTKRSEGAKRRRETKSKYGW